MIKKVVVSSSRSRHFEKRTAKAPETLSSFASIYWKGNFQSFGMETTAQKNARKLILIKTGNAAFGYETDVSSDPSNVKRILESK